MAGLRQQSRLFVKRLDLAFQFDQYRLAFAINRLARRDLDPAFAHAVLFHVKTLFVIEADTNVVFKHGGIVAGAAWV